MKIIQIIGELGFGGAERVVVNNHKMFKKFEIESKIITLKPTNFYGVDDLIVVEKDKKKAFKDLMEVITAESPDMILCHMHDMSRIFKNLKDKRFFHVIHSDWYERIKNFSFLKKIKMKRGFKKIYENKQILTVSEGIKNNFLKFGFKTAFIDVVYNPFNKEEILNLSKEFEVKGEYIIHVASLRKVKRQDVLLKAYKIAGIKEKLLIIGEGKEKENLIKLAKELSIEEKVEFLGLKSNPYPYIKNAKLLVLSSEAEGFGNVIVESLILKTPVVSTDCNSGPREIMGGKFENFLAKVNSPYDLADKIKNALKKYSVIEEKDYEKFLDREIVKKYFNLLNNLQRP